MKADTGHRSSTSSFSMSDDEGTPNSDVYDNNQYQEMKYPSSDNEDAPLFMVILHDRDFSTRYNMVRTGNATRAEVLEGKLRRKTGSVRVLALSDSKAGAFRNMFDPPPALHMIYSKHPHDSKRYIGVKTFHKVLMAEKYAELSYVLNCLGAKSVRWEKYGGPHDRLYEAPTYLEPEMNVDSPDLHFYHENLGWKSLVMDRLRGWSENGSVDFYYDDDYGVTDRVVEQILRKLGASKDVLDPEQHQEDLHNIQNNQSIVVHDDGTDHSIFKPISDRADIEFFDKEAYKLENLSVINKDWTIDHVEAFLRVIDMVKLVDLFRDDEIAGFQLTELSTKDPVEVALKYKITLPEVEDLFNCIDDLGGVEQLELVRMINEEFDILKEEHQERLRQQKMYNDEIEHRKANLPHQWQLLNSAKGAGIIDGEFEMVMIGMPGVGKTSILKSFMLHDFDAEEEATIGIAPIEYKIGLSTLRFWDMSGMVMQSSTTTLNMKYINAVVFVVDVTSYASLEWIKVILNRYEIDKHTYSLLLCNKSDIVAEYDDEGDSDYREIFEEDLLDCCDEYGLDAMVEVSALTGSRVHEAIADAVIKGDQLKHLAPKKPRNLMLGISEELDWNYRYKTLYIFPYCLRKPGKTGAVEDDIEISLQNENS